MLPRPALQTQNAPMRDGALGLPHRGSLWVSEPRHSGQCKPSCYEGVTWRVSKSFLVRRSMIIPFFFIQSFQPCTNRIEFDLKFLFLKMLAYLELHISEIENMGESLHRPSPLRPSYLSMPLLMSGTFLDTMILKVFFSLPSSGFLSYDKSCYFSPQSHLLGGLSPV